MGKAACLHDRGDEDICRKALSPPGKSHAKCLSLCMPAASQSPVAASMDLRHQPSLPQVAASLFHSCPGTHLLALAEAFHEAGCPCFPFGRKPNISTGGQAKPHLCQMSSLSSLQDFRAA